MEQGKCPIEGVIILLVQEMIYMCEPGQVDELRKKEVLVVGECSTEENIEPGQKRKFPDLGLLIEKNFPFTGFPHSDFIEVGYFIHAVAKVSFVKTQIQPKILINSGQIYDICIFDFP